MQNNRFVRRIHSILRKEQRDTRGFNDKHNQAWNTRQLKTMMAHLWETTDDKTGAETGKKNITKAHVENKQGQCHWRPKSVHSLTACALAWASSLRFGSPSTVHATALAWEEIMTVTFCLLVTHRSHTVWSSKVGNRLTKINLDHIWAPNGLLWGPTQSHGSRPLLRSCRWKQEVTYEPCKNEHVFNIEMHWTWGVLVQSWTLSCFQSPDF